MKLWLVFDIEDYRLIGAFDSQENVVKAIELSGDKRSIKVIETFLNCLEDEYL